MFSTLSFQPHVDVHAIVASIPSPSLPTRTRRDSPKIPAAEGHQTGWGVRARRGAIKIFSPNQQRPNSPPVMPPRRTAKSSSGPLEPPASALRSTPSSVGGTADSIVVKAPKSATTAPKSQMQSKRTRKPSQKAAEAAKDAAITIQDSDDDAVTTRSGRTIKKRAQGSIESPTPPPAPKRQASTVGGQSSIYSQASFSPVSEAPSTRNTRLSPLAPPAGLSFPAATSSKLPAPLNPPATGEQLQLQQAHQRIKDLEATVAKLEAEAKVKTEELGSKLQIQQANERIQDLEATVAKIEAEAKAKTDERGKLQLRQANERINDLEATVAKAEAEAKAKNDELGKLITAREEALKLVQTAQQQAAELTKEKDKLLDVIVQTESKLEKAESRMAEYEEDVKSLDVRNTELKDRVLELKRLISEDQSCEEQRYEAKQEELQEAKQKLTEAEQMIRRVIEEKYAALRDRDSFVANLDAADTKCRQLQGQLDTLSTSHTGQARALALKIVALQQQLAREKEARAREMEEHDEEVRQMLHDGEVYRQGVSRIVEHLRETTDEYYPGPPFCVRCGHGDGEGQEMEATTGQQPEGASSSGAAQPEGQALGAPAPPKTPSGNIDGAAAALATAALQAFANMGEGNLPVGQN
ncbi:hypothetical protein V8F33_005776 [Rhypophila sp. PSN 637]